MFSIVFMFLMVSPDFWLPQDQFDKKYCRDEKGKLDVRLLIVERYAEQIREAQSNSQFQEAVQGHAVFDKEVEEFRSQPNQARRKSRDALLVKARLTW